jgi:TolA-binding protein
MAELLMLEFYTDFFKGDETGMSRQTAMAVNVPGTQDWMSYSESQIAARSGELGSARSMSLQAVDQAQKAGQRERAATYEAGEAAWEALLGNASFAKSDANAALKLSQGRDVEYVAAFALALAGDYSRPRVIADDLAKRFPEDTSVQFNYLPALRGLLALKAGSPAGAVETLKAAVPYELAIPSIEFNTFFGGFYPVWVRGEVYLAQRQGTAAATEFQKIIEHRGLVAGDPIGGLALLQLGKAYTIAGQKAKARASYQNFLNLWKDADPNIPVLKQARAEFAALE